MKVETNNVDTHGQSEIGFGITNLLGFDLLPRIKRMSTSASCTGPQPESPGCGLVSDRR
ncbi:Tn3 family transposase [Nocardia vinacea]|uniref:Tn3 family transposase n=1 Tax=Nocardia vinacea TaxID=96468 RepID=UPI003F4DF6C4